MPLLPCGHDQEVSLVIIHFELICCEKFSKFCILLCQLGRQLLDVVPCSCVGAIISIATYSSTLRTLDGEQRSSFDPPDEQPICASCSCYLQAKLVKVLIKVFVISCIFA